MKEINAQLGSSNESRIHQAGVELDESLDSHSAPHDFYLDDSSIQLQTSVSSAAAQTVNMTWQEQMRLSIFKLFLVDKQQKRQAAVELHENIGQILAASKLKLNILQKLAPSHLAGSLDEIIGLTDKALQLVRSLAFELNPPILYDLGLEAAIGWLLEQIEEQYGIAYLFESDGQHKLLDDDVSTLIYHAVKELLINIAQNGYTGKIKVSSQSRGGAVKIKIEDDGTDFNNVTRNTPASCPGLFGIREILRLLGGELTIESAANQCTIITLVSPLSCKERVEKL